MANPPYLHGTVTVTASATLICSPLSSPVGVLVQNNGANTVYLGGPTVTGSGTTQGVSVAAGASVTVPTAGDAVHDLYAISPSGSTVAYLFPA